MVDIKEGGESTWALEISRNWVELPNRSLLLSQSCITQPSPQGSSVCVVFFYMCGGFVLVHTFEAAEVESMALFPLDKHIK